MRHKGKFIVFKMQWSSFRLKWTLYRKIKRFFRRHPERNWKIRLNANMPNSLYIYCKTKKGEGVDISIYSHMNSFGSCSWKKDAFYSFGKFGIGDVKFMDSIFKEYLQGQDSGPVK